MPHITVLADRCQGCPFCLQACPYEAIAIDGALARILDTCVDCDLCIPACPTTAIVPKETAGTGVATGVGSGSLPPPAPGAWRDLAVVVSEADGKLSDRATRLLALGRGMADQFGCYVWGVAVGPVSPETARAAIQAGADAVELAPDGAPSFVEAPLSSLTDRLQRFIVARRPEALLAVEHPLIEAAFSRLATRLDIPFVAGVVSVEADIAVRRLVGRVPVYGGRMTLDVASLPGRLPALISVSPGTLPPPFSPGGRTGEIVAASV